MDNCKSPASEKKSLMNTLEKLQLYKNNLSNVVDYSDNLIEKLKNPLQGPTQPNNDVCKPESKHTDIPDIIDLFNELIVSLENETDKLSKNLGKINSFID